MSRAVRHVPNGDETPFRIRIRIRRERTGRRNIVFTLSKEEIRSRGELEKNS